MNLKANERIDELNIKGYQIIQNMEGFCFGMDAVILTGFAKVKAGERVLDLGTGTGIIPLLLEAKYPCEKVTGLEIQESFVDMARRSIELNRIEQRIDIVQGDIKEASGLFPLSSFDVITSNPPYMDVGNGLTNPESMKAIARHEVLCDLNDVIVAASKLVKVGGRFYMVHRPRRLVEMIESLRANKLEPKRIRFVHSYEDKEATMVLIEAVRHGKPLMTVEPPLIVYEKVNQYTDEVLKLYGLDKTHAKD